MRVTLLGVGGSAGVPHIGGADGRGDWGACDAREPRNRRTRSSIVVEQQGQRILVDTSPDMRTQLLTCEIGRVDAILFTHAHADHILGLDDVRLLNRSRGTPIDAYATERTLADLENRFDYAFKPWTPPYFFRPVLVPHAIEPGQTVEIAGMSVGVFHQDHHFMPTLGLRLGAFGYSTDVVTLDEAAFAALEGVETWVVDCFQRQPHRTHVWLARVLEWVARLRPRRAILTHMGNDMDWDWLVRRLPANVEPGYDGMVLDIADVQPAECHCRQR